MKIQVLFIMHTTTTFLTRLSELEAFKSTEELESGITEFNYTWFTNTKSWSTDNPYNKL